MKSRAELASRNAIYTAIREHPGIHKSELCRVTGYSWGTIQHHIRSLRKMRLVRQARHGGRVHLAASDHVGENRASRALLLPHASDIIELVAQEAEVDAATIRRRLRLGPKPTRSHLRTLVAEGILSCDGAYHPHYSLTPLARRVLPTSAKEPMDTRSQ